MATPDTIYFLQTATPHLGDFSVFGPFACPAAMAPSIESKLRRASPAGLAMWHDLLLAGGPDALAGFEHLAAPLPGGHVLTLRVVRQRNPVVAAGLPGQSWIVLCAEMSGASGTGGVGGAGSGPGAGGLGMKDLAVCGAFVSVEKANEELRRVVAEKLRAGAAAGAAGRKVELPKGDGTMMCMAQVGATAWLVESKFESGVESFEG